MVGAKPVSAAISRTVLFWALNNQLPRRLVVLLLAFFAQDGPADEGEAAEEFVEEGGEGEYGRDEDQVHDPRGELGVDFHHVAECGEGKIVDNVQSEAASRHVSAEGGCLVETGFEPRHHRQARQPAVETVEWTAEIVRRGIVLTEGGDYKDDTRGHRTDQ